MKKLTLSVLLCFATHAVAEGLPDLGDISQSVLSPLQERQIGQQSMMQIRASRMFLDDPEVNDYLNQIGDRLVASSNEPALNFEFFAVDDESVNAFAIPGGFIGVNIGLLLTTQSESELASVLAHEIAHVTQHHYARLLSATQNDGLTSMAAIAVAILAARNSPQASQAAIMGAQARSVQKQLDFTRLHEQEADRIGLESLQKSSFNTHAMPEFLQRLQRATRLLEGNAPNYMRTHPITSERVADIENRVSKQPYRLIADSLDFQLIRTKLIAHQKSTADAISYFEHALTDKKFGNPVAQRYGLVLSLLRANDATRAQQEMDTLRAQAQGNALLDTLTGQVIAAQKNDQATLNYYKTAVLNHPQYRALIYDYAQLLIRTGQSALASHLLNDRISRYPADVTLYNLQAHAYQQLNKPLEQHQAQAYSYAWQGNIHAAIEQLELAKQAGGSFYQMSTIESDLRELRDMVDTRSKK
ncbi:MAG: M48 family metalloprotease [Gallionella sp.]|nr:M48 family metalloprotease [Gallionella sp.]